MERIDVYYKWTYFESGVGSCEELLELGNLVLIGEHLTLCLVFIDCKVQSVLLEDVDWALWIKSLKLASDLALASCKNLELFALKQVLEVRDFSNEFLEEDTTSLNELSIIAILHLHVLHIDGHGNFLGDRGDIDAGPALVEHLGEGLELVVAALALELSLFVAT